MKYCKKKKIENSCSAWDIDSAKEYSEESEKAIEELNLKLSEAKTSSQNLINKSIQDIKEDSEIKKSSLIKKINNEISEAEGEIKEKKETALAEISSISESLAIEMLENLSVGEIDKGKIDRAQSKRQKQLKSRVRFVGAAKKDEIALKCIEFPRASYTCPTSGGGRPPRSSSRPCWLHLPSDLTNLLRSYTLKLSITRQRVHILVKMLGGLHAPPPLRAIFGAPTGVQLYWTEEGAGDCE